MAHQFTSTEIALIVALGVVEFGLLAAAWIVLFRTPDRATDPAEMGVGADLPGAVRRPDRVLRRRAQAAAGRGHGASP